MKKVYNRQSIIVEGLEDVDNTSDMDKPVSTAQSEAIGAVNTKLEDHIKESVISDGSITKIESKTQAEFDALEVKLPTTLYIIKNT